MDTRKHHQGAINVRPHHFKPGQSGNPKGRPPGRKDGVRARLCKMLEKKAPADVIQALEDEFGKKWIKEPSCAEAAAAVMLIGAMRGDTAMLRMLLEQTEIPLPVQVQQEIEMTGPVELTIIPPPEKFADSAGG